MTVHRLIFHVHRIGLRFTPLLTSTNTRLNNTSNAAIVTTFIVFQALIWFLYNRDFEPFIAILDGIIVFLLYTLRRYRIIAIGLSIMLFTFGNYIIIKEQNNKNVTNQATPLSGVNGKIIQTTVLGTGFTGPVAWAEENNIVAHGTTVGITLYSGETLTQIGSIPSHAPISTLDFSKDGGFLAATSNGRAVVYSIPDGNEIFSNGDTRGVIQNGVISPDGQKIAVLSKDVIGRLGRVIVWDRKTKQAEAELQITDEDPVDLAISPDGKTVAIAFEHSGVGLWEIGSRAILKYLREDLETHSVVFSHQGNLLAVGVGNSSIRLWDTKDHSPTKMIDPESGIVHDLKFSFNDEYLVAAIASYVSIVDVRLGKVIDYVDNRTSVIINVSFSPDNKRIVASYSGGNMIVWDLIQDKVSNLFRSTQSATKLATSKNGNKIASLSGKNIIVWNPENILETQEYDIGDIPVATIIYSQNDQLLAVHDSESSIQVVTIDDSHQTVSKVIDIGLIEKSDNEDLYKHLVVDNKINTFAKSYHDRVYIWRQSFSIREPFYTILNVDVHNIALSSDGSLLAIAFNDILTLYSIEQKQQISSVKLPGVIKTIVFSPNSRYIGVISGSDHISNFNIREGYLESIFDRNLNDSHYNALWAISFSRDGIFISVGDINGVIHLLLATNGDIIDTIKGHNGSIQCIEFMPEQSIMTTCATDGTIKLWKVSQ